MGWKRGSNWWFVFWWAAPRSVRASGAPHHVLLPESGFSDQCADDLVEGLGLAGLVVESGAAADQGTADSSKQSPTWRIMHTDYRQPLKTLQETISTVIALHFYATA